MAGKRQGVRAFIAAIVDPSIHDEIASYFREQTAASEKRLQCTLDYRACVEEALRRAVPVDEHNAHLILSRHEQCEQTMRDTVRMVKELPWVPHRGFLQAWHDQVAMLTRQAEELEVTGVLLRQWILHNMKAGDEPISAAAREALDEGMADAKDGRWGAWGSFSEFS